VWGGKRISHTEFSKNMFEIRGRTSKTCVANQPDRTAGQKKGGGRETLPMLQKCRITGRPPDGSNQKKGGQRKKQKKQEKELVKRRSDKRPSVGAWPSRKKSHKGSYRSRRLAVFRFPLGKMRGGKRLGKKDRPIETRKEKEQKTKGVR